MSPPHPFHGWLVRRQTQEAMCVCFKRVIHEEMLIVRRTRCGSVCVSPVMAGQQWVTLVQHPHWLGLSPPIKACQTTVSTHTKTTSPMEGTLTKKVVATYSLSWLIFTSVLQEKAALYALTQAIIKYSTILKDDVDLRILNISKSLQGLDYVPSANGISSTKNKSECSILYLQK